MMGPTRRSLREHVASATVVLHVETGTCEARARFSKAVMRRKTSSPISEGRLLSERSHLEIDKDESRRNSLEFHLSAESNLTDLAPGDRHEGNRAMLPWRP